MKRIGKGARVGASGFAGILTTLVILGTSAQAHEAWPRAPQAAASETAQDQRVALNLLSRPGKGTRSTVTIQSMGTGSYLCSPAGLGKRSKCARN